VLKKRCLAAGLVDVALSPDGARVAGSSSEAPFTTILDRGMPSRGGRGIASGRSGGGDLWLGEFERGTRTRFTSNTAEDGQPVWSPDGTRIIFASNRDGAVNLCQKASSGGGNEEPLFKSGDNKLPSDWSRDGRFLLYSNYDSKRGENLWVLPLTGDGTSSGQPFSYLSTDFHEGGGRFSPDGRWIAYRSNETGQNEIYVRAFPAPSAVILISSGGGREPRWRRDGRELFYLGPRGQVMAVEVTTSPAFRVIGAARRLFDAPIYGGPARTNSFDVTADGQRFLVNTLPGARTDPGSITVVTNWQSALKR
jgi:Tol biopolymer transport system component